MYTYALVADGRTAADIRELVTKKYFKTHNVRRGWREYMYTFTTGAYRLQSALISDIMKYFESVHVHLVSTTLLSALRGISFAKQATTDECQTSRSRTTYARNLGDYARLQHPRQWHSTLTDASTPTQLAVSQQARKKFGAGAVARPRSSGQLLFLLEPEAVSFHCRSIPCATGPVQRFMRLILVCNSLLCSS